MRATFLVVINHKTTKFENNSQRATHTPARRPRCYQSQNYKIWKQFTTVSGCCVIKSTMLSITKLQNLKAIHNLQLRQPNERGVVINHKTTKFESNSQPYHNGMDNRSSCYQSQNYKIWKQFTTMKVSLSSLTAMLSITKLQNLKAIYNIFQMQNTSEIDVINHKTTKFESNSQLFWDKRVYSPSFYLLYYIIILIFVL